MSMVYFVDSCDILYYVDFVIYVYDRNEDGVVMYCCFKFFQVDNVVMLWCQVGDFKIFVFQLMVGIQYCFVFSFVGDDVFVFFLIKVGCIFDCQVVRFGCIRGKDDFMWISVDQIGNLIMGDIYCFFSLLVEMVRMGGWVIKGFVYCYKLYYFFGNMWVYWCGCGVVEINW